jgi:hypothetical protein
MHSTEAGAKLKRTSFMRKVRCDVDVPYIAIIKLPKVNEMKRPCAPLLT